MDVDMPHARALVSADRIPGQPLTSEVPAQELEPSNPVQERRKHPRHRYIERLYIGKADGTWFTAMTYEISAGGLSAATPTNLAVGEKVSLSPVVNKRVEAIVRRKSGAMYGFEFLGLTVQLEEKVRKLCESLPLFQTLIES
jgi:PilZ domain